MRKLIAGGTFFLLVLMLVISCKKEKTLKSVYMGYEYFPFDTAIYSIYQVVEITWDDFYQPSKIDTQIYQIKELNESFFYDLENRKTIRIERYKRLSDTNSWVLKDVWTANLLNTQAERNEENIRYVKLLFPFDIYTSWNGNAFNNLGDNQYEYKNIYQPYNLNNLTIDSTITVIQQDELSLINRNYAEEVYARNIGLIYRKHIEIETNPDGTVISGFDITYSLKSFNK